MRKLVIVTLTCAALVLAFVLPSLHAVDAPADMQIQVPAGGKATKAPVAFSHAKHKATECTKCHHKWDGKTAGADMKCSSKGCHDNMVSKKAGENSYYNAYHDMKAETSCLGCHKAMKKAGKPTGPNACNDCHPVKK
jgi:hypothetical protein